MNLIQACTELLPALYGLTGTLSPLPGDRDNNFCVTSESGERYVLKVMHSGCEESAIDFQCAALEHIAHCELNLPRVQRTRQGRLWQRQCFADGSERLLWLLSWCEGQLLADFAHRGGSLANSLGIVAATLHLALEDFHHPQQAVQHRWLLTNASDNRRGLKHIEQPLRRYIEDLYQRFEQQLKPKLQHLPWAVVHNDANDYNLLVDSQSGSAKVTGLFDFGDMALQPVIADIAIAMAYLILDAERPLDLCADFLRGYQQQRQLSEAEIAVLFDLICLRLATSIAISSERQQSEPDNPYLLVSQQPAIRTLLRLRQIIPAFAHCWLREACGFEAVAKLETMTHWLQQEHKPVAVVNCDQYQHIIDLSSDSPLLGSTSADTALAPLTKAIDAQMQRAGVITGFGRYAEDRAIYNSPAFVGGDYPAHEPRTEHLGIDIFCAPGTPVFAPLPAIVEIVHDNDAPLDYGPVVILRHEGPENCSFYTLYGHLHRDSVSSLRPGQQLGAGQCFAAVGNAEENGGWTPHLHLQIILDLLQLDHDFPGVCRLSESRLWRQLCPNPALLMPVPEPNYFNAAIID